MAANCLPTDGISTPTRRRLCKIVGAFVLGGAVAPLAAAPAPGTAQRAALAAFLDTLLPRDELSGSATDLGLDRQIWSFSNTAPDFRRLLEYGCRWLDMTGGPPFASLTIEQQIAVVNWMANADWNEIPRRFYELMRQVSIELYYSTPTGWRGLPIQRPPQPLGYPPPWS